MLKGIKGGVLITINNKNAIKDFETKLKNKVFFKEDIDFLLEKKDKEYFKQLWDLANKYSHNLYLIKEVEKIKTVVETKIIKEKDSLEKKVDKEDLEKIKIIEKTLRSGQKIETDGHLLIIGDANPGSEILAGGDVYVFGRARGLIHAGKNGNKKSQILALSMEVNQLRIADVYAKNDGDKPEGRVAEKAFLDENNAMIVKEFKWM